MRLFGAVFGLTRVIENAAWESLFRRRLVLAGVHVAIQSTVSFGPDILFACLAFKGPSSGGRDSAVGWIPRGFGLVTRCRAAKSF